MRGRFHFLYSLRTLRYGFLLCLIPLVRALIAFRLDAFFSALQQDLLILLAIGFLSLYLWLATRYHLQDDELVVEIGLLWQRKSCLRVRDLAACELRASLPMRMLGAAELELYLNCRRGRKSQVLLLPVRQAETMQELLFPTPEKAPVHYTPTGGEWLMLVMLSTNLVTETALIVYAVRQVKEILGMDLQAMAISRLEAWLPTGASVLLALVFLYTLCIVVISTSRLVGFRVGRTDTLLLCRGGWYTHVEQRIRLDAVNVIDVRHSLLSRITDFDSVYIYAGGFTNRNTPLFFFRRKDPAAALRLLPQLCPPQKLPVRLPRSLWIYIWFPVAADVICAILWEVARHTLPSIAPLLGILCLALLVPLAILLEGYFTETYLPLDDARVYIGYTHLLTRHFATVFLHGCNALVNYSSLSVQADLATLQITTPAGYTLAARSVPKAAAEAWVRRRFGDTPPDRAAPQDTAAPDGPPQIRPSGA